MRLLRPTSIRQRLLLISGTISLLTLLIAGSLFVLNDVHMLRGQMVRDLEVLSGVVGDNCLSALVFDAPETAEKNLATLRREHQIRYAVLYDGEGRPFADYRRDPEQMPAAPMRAGDGVFLDTALLEPWTLEVVRPLDLDGQSVGRIFIHARMDELAAQVRRYAGMVGVLFLVTLSLSLLLALRLQRRVSDPILHLAAKTRDISARGDYSVRVSAPVSDHEIATLFHGFNAMLEQIDRRERDLTHIRAHLEQLVDERTRTLDGLLREQRLILETLPLGVVHLVGRYVVRANPRAAELLGVTQEHLLGLGTERFYPSRDDFDAVGREGYARMADGGVYRADRMLQRADGTRFWGRLIGQYIDPREVERGSIWILDDIDRDKLLEETLHRARETAEAASNAKDAFLANMSHELRTPLNSVLGFVQVLEQDERLDEGQRRQVRAIRQGGERLLGLINEVLDLSRIQAGRLELTPVTWDSGELLRELADTFQARAGQKGLELCIEMAPGLPRTLSCDAKCLHQILVNLLDNAVKFTREGSVTLAADYRRGDLLVRVTDTGPGISEDRLAMIFEPFQQAGDAGSRALGLGLGLAIARRLADGMGGGLAVESALGAGARFSLRVPARVVESADGAAPAHAARGRLVGLRRTSGSGAFHILVADDAAENREILRALLAPLGLVVAEAPSGRECLERALAHPPDLILMDLRMPGLDGIEATRLLRGQAATRKVPVVAVTAAAFEEDRARALAAGCDAHLVKPVKLSALADALEALLPLTWEHAPAGLDLAAPAPAEALPPELAPRLARLLATGNMTGVAALAAELGRAGCCPALAHRMAVLAEEFDLPGLERLLSG